MEAKKTSPSRDFLVRQATLSALAKSYPASFRLYGAAGIGPDALREVRCGSYGPIIVNRIRYEFRELAKRHGVQVTT